jgi:putative transposase
VPKSSREFLPETRRVFALRARNPLSSVIFTRRIVGFGVEPARIDGISVCRMFNQARCAQPLPKRLSTHHDPWFRFHRWRANLRILEIEELESVPFMPRSHPFIERLIGTLRREYLDQTFFWNASTFIAS